MIRIFNHYVPRLALVLLLMELGILLAAANLAALAALGELPVSPHGGNAWLAGLVFALTLVFIMGTLGMYGSHVCMDMPSILVRILPAFGLGYALLSAMLHAVPSLACMLDAAGVLTTRLLLRSSAYAGILVQRLIVVGDGSLARECLELARSQRGLHRFEVVGFVPSADAPSSLLALARHYNAHEVVVAIDERRSGDYPIRALLECALGGVRVTDAAAFFEREAAQIRVDSLQPSYLTFGGGFDQGVLRAAVKRAFDLGASAVFCVLGLPLMAAAALAILLEDGGPVIYHQERVGRDGRLFQLLKFRSMRRDAEPDGMPRWAQPHDVRVTRVGYWLRKLRIDELPQMVNVLRGEMSFVGPRPERAYFVAKLGQEIAYYDVRHSIKPGIAGLAQVRYRYGASVEDALRKLQYDLYYVKNNSLFLDLLILFGTVQVVLYAKGSR